MLGILRDLQAFFWLRVFLLPSRVHARASAMLRERKPLASPSEPDARVMPSARGRNRLRMSCVRGGAEAALDCDYSPMSGMARAGTYSVATV